MLRPLIRSSIAFFLGTMRLVLPLCSEPKMFPSMCNTSSDDLKQICHKSNNVQVLYRSNHESLSFKKHMCCKVFTWNTYQ